MKLVNIDPVLLVLITITIVAVVCIVIYIRSRQFARERFKEEERKRHEVEAQRKAEEERQRREAEEAQKKTGSKLDIEQAIAVEPIALVEGAAQQETGEERHPGAETEIKRIEPPKRGGRLPGNRKVEAERSETSEKKPHVLKPEVVCWKKARKWFVGIETPEKYQEYVGLAITQNDTPLTQDDEGRWVLLQITGIVCIIWSRIERPIEISLEKPYMLFRLVGASINRGRRVRYATAGSFLVVASEQWQRDEQISGHALVSPENVAITGYLAHYFLLDRESGGRISFLAPGSKPEIIPARASRFELTGTRLPDASENMGLLFGEEPPRIRTLDQNGWNSVKTIIVGQEGWRIDFAPEPDHNEQCPPVELSERRSGWYFIRFYDDEDNLIESLDFRFVSALKGIRISPHSPVPDVKGHIPVKVEFLHNAGCAIELNNPPAENLPIEREGTRTIVTIPADPIWDETRWMIRAEGGAQVEAKILVERVWWALGEGVEGESIGWIDVPISISRGSVTATSRQAIWFRLPRRRWASEIHVGFERLKARTYPVEVVKRGVMVPLSNFEGTQEIEDRRREHLLKLWIKEGAEHDMSVVVAAIPATQPPIVTKNVCRMRKYLRRLERRTEDSALGEMIHKARARWLAPVSETDSGSRQIETACVIALVWEIFRANGVKPLGRHKRWIRKLVELASAYPETMQGVRDNYKMLKCGDTGIVSPTKR